MSEDNTQEIDDFDDVEEVEQAEPAKEEKPKPAKKAPAKKAKAAKKKKVPEGTKVFTYVGGGEDSPRKIKFMGRQTFIRGEATEVSDPILLAKIEVNPSFVEGEVDPESLHDADEAAAEKAAAQKAEDKKLDKKYKKLHG